VVVYFHQAASVRRVLDSVAVPAPLGVNAAYYAPAELCPATPFGDLDETRACGDVGYSRFDEINRTQFAKTRRVQLRTGILNGGDGGELTRGRARAVPAGATCLS